MSDRSQQKSLWNCYLIVINTSCSEASRGAKVASLDRQVWRSSRVTRYIRHTQTLGPNPFADFRTIPGYRL
jgi:hypothetical protein